MDDNIYETLMENLQKIGDEDDFYEECPICESFYEEGDNWCSSCGFDLSVDLKKSSNSNWDWVEIEDKKQKVYILGPMRGKENFNYLAFFEAELKLKKMGYDIINPARNPHNLSVDEYMRIDLIYIGMVDIIYRLNGWQYSGGSIVENALGNYRDLIILDE